MHDPRTHIHLLLDRSGSMESIRQDVIGGFNAFVRQQQQEPTPATLTLVQFDSHDPYDVVLRCVPLAEVPPLTPERFVPRGMTPLLDALGRSLNELDATLAALPPAERPDQVVLVVVTDGLENASRVFTYAQVRQMLAAHEAAGWQLVYLSADLSAMAEAEALGFAPTRRLAFDRQGTAAMWQSVSNRTSEFRTGRRRSLDFDEEDRQRQQREQQRRTRPQRRDVL